MDGCMGWTWDKERGGKGRMEYVFFRKDFQEKVH